MEKTSKHIGVATELTCLMQIKEGFLPLTDTRTYATRLRAVLKVLNLLRLTARESSITRPIVDIVESAGTVYSFSWTIVRERELLLNVVFDRPWEPYIRIIWADLGPFIDLMLCNCREFSPSKNGFDAFVKFVRTHQVEAGFFYTASSMTVDDQRYLAQFEKQHRLDKMSKKAAAIFAADGAKATAARILKNGDGDEAFLQWMRAFEGLHGLRNLFPDDSPDHEFLREATRALLSPSLEIVEAKLRALGGLRGRRAAPAAPPLLEAALEWFHELKPTARAHASLALTPPLPSDAPQSVDVDLGTIQGGILHPISGTSHGCVLLARIVDRSTLANFNQWLSERVSTAAATQDARSEKAPTEHWSVAYTCNGLRACGVTESELDQFPKEFREGMAERAGMLGDVRQNHPDRWVLPEWNVTIENGQPHFLGSLGGDAGGTRPRVRLSTIDMVITVRLTRCFDLPQEWTSQNPLHGAVLRFCDEASRRGVIVLAVQPLRRLARENPRGERVPIEHFGFADGITNPQIHLGSPSSAPAGVPLGELLVGHENNRGDKSFPSAAVAPGSLRAEGSLLHNGSFLVVRKLRQHVEALTQALEGIAHSTGVDTETLRAKMMGRSSDGRPIVAPNLDARAHFDFTSDKAGEVCPWHAHIRRANPRLSTNAQRRHVPMIFRRGMPYGPPYDPTQRQSDHGEEERGLMFMAYNASIADQFEIIQRWISGGNTPTENGDVAVFGGQPDPFLGLPDADGQTRTFRFVHQGKAHSVPLGTRPFVTLQWGLYAFTPSIPALRSLTGQAKPDVSAAQNAVVFGTRLLGQLKTTADWMGLLEDISLNQSGATAAVCAALNASHGGVLRTPYGVLVTSRERVEEVLRHDSIYSVSEYQARFGRSVGEGFLGLDHGRQYLEESAGPNAALQLVSEQKAYDDAVKATGSQLSDVLRDAKETQAALGLPGSAPRLLKLDDLVERVLAELSHSWFDIPDGDLIKKGGRPKEKGSPWGQDLTLHLPFHLLPASRYVFSTPNPLPTLESTGQANGQALRRQVRTWVEGLRRDGRSPDGPIAQELFRLIQGDDDRLARTLLGLVFGFLPTVYGNALAVLGQWLDQATLWRLQQRVLIARSGSASLSYHQATQAIGGELTRAMLSRPVPALLHRTVTTPTRLGEVGLQPNDRVVLVMTGFTPREAAAATPDVSLVFGGDRTRTPHPTHACSGYHIAMGVLTGFFVGLLEAHEYAPTPALFTVRVLD